MPSKAQLDDRITPPSRTTRLLSFGYLPRADTVQDVVHTTHALAPRRTREIRDSILDSSYSEYEECKARKRTRI